MRKHTTLFPIFLLLLAACKKEEATTRIPAEVFSASDNIVGKVEAFRERLGPLNTEPGAAGGRREINWDGVPDDLLHTKLPVDFFNPVGNHAATARQRGLSYSAAANFQVSDNGFEQLNPQASEDFRAFSGSKVFASVGSNQWQVDFRVPGQSTLAAVKGFGLVFSDVDDDRSASVEFFNGNQSLGKWFVPAGSTRGSFSFLGVYFPHHKVTHVQVQHQGTLSSGAPDRSQGGADDLVVLDDFIYSEPEAL